MTRQQLEQLFSSKNIDFSRPGFYDDANFLAAEEEDNRFLENYALYVESLDFSPEYLAAARTATEKLSSFLFDELRRDGRLGACVDISGAFARMLDEQGVWAYPVAGGVSVTFPEPVGERFFGAISKPGDRASVGHMWVRVPPFQVVDISFALQPWGAADQHLPQQTVKVETFEPHVPTIFELVDIDFLRDLERSEGELPTVGDVLRNKPFLGPFMRTFRAFETRVADLPVAYVPTAIKMSQLNLTGLRQPVLSGRLPQQLYDAFLRLEL